MADLHLLLFVHALQEASQNTWSHGADSQAQDVHLLLEYLQSTYSDGGPEPVITSAQQIASSDHTVARLLRMLLQTNQANALDSHAPVAMLQNTMAPAPSAPRMAAHTPPSQAAPAQPTHPQPAPAQPAPKRGKRTERTNDTETGAKRAPAAKLTRPKSTRTSQYKGVSRHRLTKRWEASVWSKGKQLYLGGFDTEVNAAKAYDVAALVLKGNTGINFEVAQYKDILQELKGVTQDEVVAYIRRQSSAFARGTCRYRGVSKNQHGRWESRIGHFQGRKNVNLGSFETQEEAAQQYDRALVIENGTSAKTNFPMSFYVSEMSRFEAWAKGAFGHLGAEGQILAVNKCILPPLANGSFNQHNSYDDSAWRRGMIFAKDLHQALAARKQVAA